MAKPRRTKHKPDYMRPIVSAPVSNCDTLIYKIDVFYRMYGDDLSSDDSRKLLQMLQQIEFSHKRLQETERKIMNHQLDNWNRIYGR